MPAETKASQAVLLGLPFQPLNPPNLSNAPQSEQNRATFSQRQDPNRALRVQVGRLCIHQIPRHPLGLWQRDGVLLAPLTCPKELETTASIFGTSTQKMDHFWGGKPKAQKVGFGLWAIRVPSRLVFHFQIPHVELQRALELQAPALSCMGSTRLGMGLFDSLWTPKKPETTKKPTGKGAVKSRNQERKNVKLAPLSESGEVANGHLYSTHGLIS